MPPSLSSAQSSSSNSGADPGVPHCQRGVSARPRGLHRHRSHVLDLVSPTPGRVLFGAAATISYYPSCSCSRSTGWPGVLTDGRLRDFAELAGYDFAAYCSGEATHWGGDVVTPFQANVPVVVGGVGMMPGQYVYADAAGAVVIPDGEIDDVLAAARKIVAEDEAFRAPVAGEVSSGPSTGASERSGRRTRLVCDWSASSDAELSAGVPAIVVLSRSIARRPRPVGPCPLRPAAMCPGPHRS